MDFNFGSTKNIDYDPFASLSNVSPVQTNFNSYEQKYSTNATNNISFDFNTGNDMNFGMGIGIGQINQNQNWNKDPT